MIDNHLTDFESLKQLLDEAPRDPAFLREYVRERDLHRNEEDIFIRLAFRNVSVGAAYSKGDRQVTSVFSELYEPLSPEVQPPCPARRGFPVGLQSPSNRAPRALSDLSA
jgi:hypothetical protein